MKIGPHDNKPAVNSTPTERKTSTSSSGARSAEPSAKVQLSATAMLSAGSSDSVFDAEKVKRIADAIRDGKYEIDANAIADKLIANAQELLSPRRKA
jgi:negative regulator of flagellin synthesis FlgM